MQHKKTLFFLILFSYAALYIATSKQIICESDCQKRIEVYNALSAGRTYVYMVNRCTAPVISDSLCIFVHDTSGINWNLFADTACLVATQQGLPRQKIFIIRNGNTGNDTLAQKVCP
jgi:hypothetical protein